MKPGIFQVRKRVESRMMFLLCTLFSAAILGTLALVTWFLVSKGFSAMSWDFFTKGPELNERGVLAGGMRNGIEGTLILLGLASLIGVPTGLLAGVYLAEYSSEVWLANPARFVADVLSGVPSIVVGILGYELVVVPMGRFSGWAGVSALAFIMIPIVARTSEEMLKLVPQSYREGSLALGATKAQTILRVVVPAASGSVVTGVMLAVARVAGETAPLLFTALGTRLMTRDPSQPFPSLTLMIFNYAKSPSPDQQRLAWAGILVLIMILFILNLATRSITTRSIRSRVG
jgi:phosphate transport system permease protein